MYATFLWYGTRKSWAITRQSGILDLSKVAVLCSTKKFWYLYYQLSQRAETGGVAVSWRMPFLVSELLNRLFAGAWFDLYWGGG